MSAACGPRAAVLMSGVQVGTVSEIKLSPEGTNVFIYSEDLQPVCHSPRRPLRHRAIRLSGRPICRHLSRRRTRGRCLTNSAMAHAEEPFNLQEVARSANGFIQRMDADRQETGRRHQRRPAAGAERANADQSCRHHQHTPAGFRGRPRHRRQPQCARRNERRSQSAWRSATWSSFPSRSESLGRQRRRACWPPTGRKSPWPSAISKPPPPC